MTSAIATPRPVSGLSADTQLRCGSPSPTQEAADLLGVNRPTLVKLLGAGAIPEQPGRHRRVRHADVLAFGDGAAQERRSALDRMVEIADVPGPAADEGSLQLEPGAGSREPSKA